MAQIKIFGLKTHLGTIMRQTSELVHACVVDALEYPQDKRAHRFFLLDPAEFYYPAGRTEKYTILEISMFEGRTVQTKKKLMRLLFERFATDLGVPPMDLEITIFETPKHNWAFRGLPGDEHTLNYAVEV